MIKHIVLWKLKPFANGRDRLENAQLLKKKLQALEGRIPGLLKIEVGFDLSKTESSSDVSLYSEFVSKEALNAYQDHPLHVEVKDFLAPIREERRIVDYES